MCRSTEIYGYAFCLGLEKLELDPNPQGLVLSVADLIKGAVLRPKHAKSRAHRFSLDIGPLGQLIDMFQNREATDPREENRSPLSQSWADKHLDTDFEWRVGRAVILWNSELRHHVQRRGRA